MINDKGGTLTWSKSRNLHLRDLTTIYWLLPRIRKIVDDLGFEASHIMIPWSDVYTVPRSDNSVVEACKMAQMYDYVPVIDSGRICGLVDTKEGRTREEWIPIVLPSGTPIVDVVEKVCDLHMGGRPTMIVLGEGENYEGWLDHTDFDKPQVSTMLYAIFSDFEVKITALISKLPQEDWLACLGSPAREKIEARFADKENRRLQLDMLHYTFLIHKVQIVKATEGLWRQLGFNSEKDAGRLFKFNDWRNRISHKADEDEDLLYEKADLEGLGELLKMIENSLDLLSSADKN